jgi:hypothetical protein
VEWLDDELERNPDIREVLVVEIHGAGGACANGGKEAGEERSSDQRISEERTGEEQNSPTSDPEAHGGKGEQTKANRGWFFQAFAPPSTVLKVRGTAQRTNNEVALEVLIDKWDKKDVDFIPTLFAFDGTDSPTQWHLTPEQKRDIEDNWQAEWKEKCNSTKGWSRVNGFLETQEGGSE